MTSHTASFTVQMAPGAPIDGAADRFSLTKTWTGEAEGTFREESLHRSGRWLDGMSYAQLASEVR